MATATLTSKGQITIPIKIRKALGLKTGDRIEIFEQEDGKYVLQPRTGSIMEMEGCLAGVGAALSLEEMDQAILDHVVELDDATRSQASASLSQGEAA
jgi:AbrB family looped-hinge helix DNA binding protein